MVCSYTLPNFMTHADTLSKQSGKGKAGKSASGKTGGDSKTQSRSAKAGLQFPVGRIHRLLKRGNYAQRVGAGAPGMSRPVYHYVSILSRVQYTLLPFLNTSPPRFSSLQGTPLVITRSNVLSLATFNSPSAMMKSKLCFVMLTPHLYLSLVLRLNKLLGHVVISQGGVVPFINPELLPNKSAKGKKEGASQEV